MLTFRVTLSHADNQDRFKFVTVEECKNLDDCLNHIWATEKDWVIDAVKRIWMCQLGNCPLSSPNVLISCTLKESTKGIQMTIDYNNVFTKDNDLLIEISQFINNLNNRILSENIILQRDLGVTTLDAFNAQLIEEINEYKVYDCW